MAPKHLHYCNLFATFLTGCYVASYGPLIPFFAKKTQLDQTHYAYIFLVRAIANIFGSLLFKKIAPMTTVRSIVLWVCFLLGGSLIVNTFSLSTFNIVLTLFIASLSTVILNIVVVAFNFTVFSPEQATHNIQMLGFIFGAGAMTAPFIVMHLRLHTYIYLAIPCLLLIPLYLYQDLPSLSQHQTRVNSKQIIGTKSQLLISLMMLIYATEQIGMSNWIPTYAIKTGVSDYQEAAVYSMYFWLPSCLFRLIWIIIPLTFDQKLMTIVYGLCLTTFLGLVLHAGEFYDWVCYFSPITSGILLSNLYAFFLALPVQKGFAFTSNNSAHLAIANCLGQGLLIAPLGWSMGFWGSGFLLLFLCFCSVLLWYSFDRSMVSLEEDHKEYREYLLREEESNFMSMN